MIGRSKIDLYLLGLGLIVVLIAQLLLNNGVTSDGCLYFAHLRSLVFDHDLQIGPELDVLKLPPRPHHVVPIGPAILWAPFYLIVAAADWLGGELGFWTRETAPALGLTGAYVRAALIASFGAAAAGLVALHLRIRREFGGGIALCASALTFGATTLAWYVVFEPAMTHAASFGVVALALVLTERWLVERLPTRRQAAALGAIFSIVILIRPEDGLFLLFPAAALAFAPLYQAGGLRGRLRIGIEMLAGALPLLALQLVMLATLMSASTFALVGGNEAYLTLASRWSDVLFSSRHGLLSWTPAVWAGLIGTVLYVRRNTLWALPALLVFIALVWINGSAHDWSGGWAFGGRRFTSVLAAFAPGLAAALAGIRRHPLAIITPVVGVVVGWNALLMTQYERQLLPADESVRFDALVRQQADLLTKPPYLYPFAFPANVWFARREGLPVDRYDLLGSEPLRREMYLPLNDWGARFLLDGWENAGGDSFGSRHFLVAPSGTIVIPLDVPSGTPFALDVEARADGAPGTGTAILDVSMNGRSFGEIALDVGAPAPSRRLFVAPAGAKVWRRGYNRATISRLGVRLPGAPRPPTSELPPGVRLIVYALRLGPQGEPARVP